jgi:LPXTG-motif cell wall-anchored protein
MMPVKGARALASGMLALAVACAVPAISAAQDAGTTTTDVVTTTTTATSTTTTPAPATKPAPEPGPAPGPATTTTAAPPGGASVTTSVAHTSASATVTMADFFFSPGSVTVSVGDTVTWRNTGQAPHNATADDGSFATETINGGQSTSHTFDSAGSFSYICTIHPNMHGTVRVLSSGSGSGGGGSSSSSSSGGGASGSGQSEASAVASPDAAGDSTTLPMTGMAAGALALVGLALLASGLLVRRGERRRLL